jgi:glutamate dehydrogenase
MLLRERRAAASVGVDIGGGMEAGQATPASLETGGRGDNTGRMAGAIEKKKAALVGKAAALAAEILDAAERATAERVIGEFYEHVPPADIIGRGPRDLCGAALALWHFAERRRPGRAKIRVYNPDPAADGWLSPHTIVEIVNDDMPFLVDSVSLAINAGGRVVHLVIHPIVTVARDPQGRLCELRDAAAAGQRESWMHIEITRESDREDLAALAQTLSAVLADVRSAVDDWQPMRERLRELVDELSRAPAPPVPPAERAEVSDFLRWLDDDNFTFLGYREYLFDAAAAPVRGPLGILRDEAHPVFGGLRDLSALPRDVQDFLRRRELLVVTKTNRRATVHRTAPMDAIGVRPFASNGDVVGITLFLGLFTSLAYSRNPQSIPLLRRKVRRIVERAGLAPTSHDGKALLHILDTFPRDELFESDEDQLFRTVIGVLNLQERQRIALFIRRDPLERFVSCLVYVPRERYEAALRERFAAILAEAFAGRLANFQTHLDESPLARIHFIIHTTRGSVPAVEDAALEGRLAEAGRSWADRLLEAAIAAFGEEEAHDRLRRLQPFPITYQARTEAEQAIADLGRIETVLAGSPIEVSLHSPAGGGGLPGLRIYRAKDPVALSDVLPILENLGLRVVAEEPFRIESVDGAAVWIHEFQLAGVTLLTTVSAAISARFEEALVAVWTGRVENDGFNRLVLAAGLSARQIVVLRLYAKVLRQIGTAFSQAYMEDALGGHPEIARRLVRLFEIRFDPARAAGSSLPAIAEIQAIDHALDVVESLDEDRILRGFLTLVLKTVRTNYYQRLPSGETKPYLAVKLASSEIDLMPLPRPLFEIYVYSPRVEAVHMRAGRVARGGIRWSDRKEDFRTEILGLMKAQTVKNAVIVPVGAKGGFVVKQPPASPETLGAEAVKCYKSLIRGLLDLTDNIVAETPAGHRIAPPSEVVRYDGDDPYLVVAADKGTATFSDFANAISHEYGFWLGDAFASGGSAGYDHKAMGITARGAWELVARHFRELGRDIATSDLNVIGVGDMSGDVFGNAMLMSRHIRLLGAFNHLHVFIDPEPDAAGSYAERKRLFETPRSSWTDYDPRLISPGGGIFERSAKSIPISAEVKRAFAIAEDHLTPAELIQRLLTAQVDLLYLGGIGTFVKARSESHAQVGDKANDALRVDGEAIGAKVIGEGANLGVTQRGRIAYAEKGGRINTDAIDNSAGVSMSDHEVNIKILLGQAIATGALGAKEREPLLAQMTDDVAALVLRDNYLQGQALSVAEAKGPAALNRQVLLIRELEKAGRLDRALEFLPDDEEIGARAAAHKGLTRPELAVLLAHSKMSVDHELLQSDLPDAPELAAELRSYFPPALRERFPAQIATHPLRREITATLLTNDLVNRAGVTFISEMQSRTGRPAPKIARAYRIVREAFDLPRLWAEIEALDNRVAAALQSEMLLDIAGVVEHAAAWLLRAERLDMGGEASRFTPAVAGLAADIADLLPASERVLMESRGERLAAAGVPPPLAARIAGFIFLITAFEIGDLAARAGQPVERTARTFYGVGARFALDELRAAARRLPTDTLWQKAAAETLIDDFYTMQAEVAERILQSADGADAPIVAWTATRAASLAPAEVLARELRATATPDLAMLLVASRQLRQALG